MNRFSVKFKSKSIGFIINAACVFIIAALALSLLISAFTGFKKGIHEAVGIQTGELSKQIVYNYENYINNIIETSSIIQNNISRVNTPEEWADISYYLKEIINLNNDIIKISIYDYDTFRCIASSDAFETGEPLNGGDTVWFYEAIGDPTVHVFSIPYSEIDDSVYKVNVSRRLILQNGSAGVLKIEVSFRSFIDLVSKSNLGERGHITIVDPYYEIVYTSHPNNELTPQEIAVIREIILGNQNAVFNGFNMAVNVDTLSNTKWRICVFINIDTIADIESRFLTTTIIVSCIILVTGVLLFTAVTKAITRPIKQLELVMSKVEQSDYFRIEEVNITASKEVNALAWSFNKMMKKINELMGRVITEQDARRKSALTALQHQINPHFLYNTLDSILWLIENEKNPEACEMVVALARLFRIGISNDDEVIPVRDEIEHVRNYLLIQSVRYSDSFEYEFDADEKALDVMTLKLILQPIVENCIYHALKNNIDRGRIIIRARAWDDYLELSVTDNGYGMRQEAIDELYTSFRDSEVSSGVGLKNIYQRVMIYYGGNADMIIESELDTGTTITIKEPIKYNDGASDINTPRKRVL